MYAIIKTGGKQYRVSIGDTVKVESLGLEAGAKPERCRQSGAADRNDLTHGHPPWRRGHRTSSAGLPSPASSACLAQPLPARAA